MVLLVLPWIFIQVGIGAALAWRHGVSPVVGAACGMIPVPCVGWLVVMAVARRGLAETTEQFRAESGLANGASTVISDDDGW